MAHPTYSSLVELHNKNKRRRMEFDKIAHQKIVAMANRLEAYLGAPGDKIKLVEIPKPPKDEQAVRVSALSYIDNAGLHFIIRIELPYGCHEFARCIRPRGTRLESQVETSSSTSWVDVTDDAGVDAWCEQVAKELEEELNEGIDASIARMMNDE